MEDQHEQDSGGYSRWRTAGLVMLLTIKWLIIFVILGGLFAGGAVTGYVASFVKDDPIRSQAEINEKMNENAITGFVYFNDGLTPVGQLRTEEDRRLIEMKDIPSFVIDAVLATEDNNFYDHIGIDMNGLGRAVKERLLNEGTQTGGSTLTQQLARQVFLSLDKTDARKVKEIFLSLRLERYLTKPEILTAYLNKVQFGTGANGYNVYGIKAAAKGIFNISDLNKLSIAQAAYLAGLPQRPSAYTAFNNKGKFNEKGFTLAMERQKIVLSRMLETERITKAQYDEALKFDIKASLARPTQKAYTTYPYLMLEAERQAAEILVRQKYPNLSPSDVRKKENAPLLAEAREQLLRGGYKIYTTIDKRVYNIMHEIGSNPENFTPDSKEKGIEQIAAVMLDHKTGAIIGMLEGRDFYVEQMNYATQMTRQPGSTMKTIAAYLPAIEKGLVQPASILDDAPIILKDGQKGFHIPKNANGYYSGLVTAREALNRSLNLPALKVFLDKVTIPEAWKFVRKLGITTIRPEDDYAQTGVIGGLSIGVSVEELTNAYGAIANNGVFNDAYMISLITDSRDNVVYKYDKKPTRVFSEQTSFLMTDMLRTVIADGRGTGNKVRSEFKNYGKIPVVGKTGSTQDYGDVWFMGYSPDLTLGVWAGYEKQANTLTENGRARARKIWSLIMSQVTDAKPELFLTKEFKKPDGIVQASVSGVSGKLPTDLTRQMGRTVYDYFNKKYVPTEYDDALMSMSYITYNGVNYIPQASTPSDMVRKQIVIKRDKPLDILMQEIAAAQVKMPGSSRRSLDYYLPRDAGKDAPSKIDPRGDDGRAPSPPANVRFDQSNGTSRVTFSSSPENDVVGYRLYRSLNQSGYAKVGSSILAGEGTQFTEEVSANGYTYYVTAVDVAGRESAPSAIVGAAPPPPDNPEETVPPPVSGIGQQQPGQGNEGTGPETSEPPAANGSGTDSSNQAELSAPSAPAAVSVTATEQGYRLSWSANSAAEKVTSYIVYFSDGSGKYKEIAKTSNTKIEYITNKTTGSFRVKAVNASGQSDSSATVPIS
ncbi:transglycosylase domain-containing protein [Paenibacillus sp. GCM10027626]|uniref:transglycosylase domain-containing protein n=1 Tax=Paenibacillus sp. GCM10027626 TaxID=3273411 RepID=UPI00362EB65B